MAKNWSDYDGEHMGIAIEILKRSELPLDVHSNSNSISNVAMAQKVSNVSF